jgi:signal transduction histidine kinase
MRRRLLAVLSAFSLLAVAAFALPLLTSTAAERTQRFVLSRTADLDRFAMLAQQSDAEADVQLVQEIRAYRELYGEGVVVVDRAGGPQVEVGLHAGDPGVSAAVDGALRNQPVARPDRLGPGSDDPILFARPIGIGTEVGGAVVLRASPAAAAADIAAAWVVVLAGALAAAVAFAGLALLLARWVLRPVAELTAGVRAVTEGVALAHVSPRAGPSELRELAAAFNRMSEVVSTSAEQQRRLVADTSHQLRNPLAALRLRVDALDDHVDAAGTATYRSTLAEVDRLEALLDALLVLASAESRATDLAAGDAGGERVEVGAVIAQQVELWTPVAHRAGVALVEIEGPPAEVACSASELAQVLDVLLDNAVTHAGAGATAWVTWSRDAGRIRLQVRDNGPGLPAEHLPLATQRFWRAVASRKRRGSGLGLAIADRIAEARGGALGLANAAGGGLVVTLELPCP